MPWGIPVPDDPEHVMYVWFDALVNYISTLGWPHSAKAPLGTAEEEGDFEKYWVNGRPTQYAGKDNLRQQSAMWQAMLLSAGLPPSRQIVINGFIVGEDGRKMSKSLGNVVSPLDIVEEYGVDALRYFIIRELHPFEDSAVSPERFRETYNANLANGLGNVVSRITKMAETHLAAGPAIPEATIPAAFHEAMNDFDLQAAAEILWERIARLDARIAETEPFKLVKTDPAQAKEIIQELAVDLYTVGRMLNPIMPETSAVIKEAVKSNTKPETLFPRR